MKKIEFNKLENIRGGLSLGEICFMSAPITVGGYALGGLVGMNIGRLGLGIFMECLKH